MTVPHDPPSQDRFTHALDRFARFAERDDDNILDVCVSVLRHHGAPSERVAVVYHGYTNCPAQMSALSDALYAAGFNVLTPRAPGHGYADRSAHRLERHREAEMKVFAEEMVDIAADLGGRLLVVGFSFGGMLAAWVASHDDRVRECLLVAPAFLPAGTPMWAGPLLPWLARVRPERLLWWDPIKREGYRGSPYSYTKLSRRGIGAVFGLGQEVWHGEPTRSTPLDLVVLAINDNDRAINNAAARRAVYVSIGAIAEELRVHRFPQRLGYPHDMLDPLGMNAGREHEAVSALLELLEAHD